MDTFTEHAMPSSETAEKDPVLAPQEALNKKANNIAEVWQKQNELPQVDIEIAFGGHVTAKDFDKTAKRLKSADVFIPESAMWPPCLLDGLRAVSSGELSPEEYKRSLKDAGRTMSNVPDHSRAMIRSLYNTSDFPDALRRVRM